MYSDINNFLFTLMYVVSLEIRLINSRTSTMWRLNSDETKIIEADHLHHVMSFHHGAYNVQFVPEDDLIFNIIASTSTALLGTSWVKRDFEYYCDNCHTPQRNNHENSSADLPVRKKPPTTLHDEETLDCGKPVNFTHYDNLIGILKRSGHPNVSEPQLSLMFSKSKKNKDGNYESDVAAMERRLKKAKKEKPKIPQLYNQIGNYLRVKGECTKAIECFRHVLAVSPQNAEVLLNLARVLYSLQYLDDAIYLTRRSLEVLPPDKETWQHHFTLGEIFKAYGHYHEAILHLKHALKTKPDFEPAQNALKEMQKLPEPLHTYTLVIIVCLVFGVLLVLLANDNSFENEYHEIKPQRYFNKAMAMRSLRGLSLVSKARIKKLNT